MSDNKDFTQPEVHQARTAAARRRHRISETVTQEAGSSQISLIPREESQTPPTAAPAGHPKKSSGVRLPYKD